MIFVADKIPAELQRIVEFLNQQMDPAEVLAVEIKQYIGQGLKTLAPRVLGQTSETQKKKPGAAREDRSWDEASFLEELKTKRGADDARIARKILEWTGLENSKSGGEEVSKMVRFFHAIPQRGPALADFGLDLWESGSSVSTHDANMVAL